MRPAILLATKLLIVLVRGYLAAYLTDKMVFVVPTVAASMVVIAGLSDALTVNRRGDNDGDGADDGAGDPDAHEELDGALEMRGNLCAFRLIAVSRRALSI